MCSASSSTSTPRRSRRRRSPRRTAPGSATCGRPSGRARGRPCSRSRAPISVSCSPCRIRIAFWTPVTPARERASSTGGHDACMSRSTGVSLTSRAHRRGTATRPAQTPRGARAAAGGPTPGSSSKRCAGDISGQVPSRYAESRADRARATMYERRRRDVAEPLAHGSASASRRSPRGSRGRGRGAASRTPGGVERSGRRPPRASARVEPRADVHPRDLVEVSRARTPLPRPPRRRWGGVVLRSRRSRSPTSTRRVDAVRLSRARGRAPRGRRIETADHVRALDAEAVEQRWRRRRASTNGPSRSARPRRSPRKSAIDAVALRQLGITSSHIVRSAMPAWSGGPARPPPMSSSGHLHAVDAAVSASSLSRLARQRSSRDSRRSFSSLPPVWQVGQYVIVCSSNATRRSVSCPSGHGSPKWPWMR